MRITVVTATGNRHEAFELCEYWMKQQSHKPFQVIVLDDGDTKTKCTMGQDYIYCPEFKGPASLTSKLKHLMKSEIIKGDGIVFVEDDDYYSPNWLKFCAEKLTYHNMVGEGRALYYNVAGRWWYEHHNMHHASLCATALDRSMFRWLMDACNDENPFVDSRLWHNAKQKGNCQMFDPLTHGGRMVVGIKGMPGRAGYGMGHGGRDVNARDDHSLAKLTELLGKDAELYEGYIFKKPK